MKRLATVVVVIVSGGILYIAWYATGEGWAERLSGIITRPAPLPQQAKPNIVFILIDDMGWRDVGFMGSTYYETPAIDQLAAQGVVFTSAYANAPNCAPTRASLMSGQYTHRHGIYTVAPSARGDTRDRKLLVEETETTLNLEAVSYTHLTLPTKRIV